MKFSKELEVAIKAALKAGKEVIKIYESKDFEIQIKSDNSPLTKADKISHQVITAGLKEINLPFLSEEGSNIDYAIRKEWYKFWMIDPIDGTKEFIKRNGEFTINIALIENGTPVLGVVYAPVLKDLFFAQDRLGSFKISNIEKFEDIKRNSILDLKYTDYPETYTMVVSRSHMNEETQHYVEHKETFHKNVSTVSYGSSLKICKVAEGSAHCYPRFGPTMEWDTAAAHAIAAYSNCKVTQVDETSELRYNKNNLLNPYFIIQKK